MDDIQMADDSSPSGSLSSQRFNIADMLSESNRSTLDSISGALMTSATADAVSIGSSLFTGSVYYEKNDELISQRLQSLYPFLDHKKDPLPRYWNSNNKVSSYWSISLDYLRIQYKGKSSPRADAKDAALVRANRPIPSMAIVYYFEIYIVNKDSNGLISVGLSDKSVPVNRIPGWDENSYGYHANDGQFMIHGGTSQKSGPKYATGDVVGCGLNFITRELFFTKNGHFIGVATSDIRNTEKLFPTVGMQLANEVVDANFGQKPFKFDIKQYMEEAQANITKTIRNIELPYEKALWMNKTVSGWLEHEGYSRALDAFNATTGSKLLTGSENGTSKTDSDTSNNIAPAGGGAITRRSVVKQVQEVAANEEMENRRALSRLVQSGRMSDAIKEIECLYPTLLTSNKELALLLKIQLYVEMLADVAKEGLLKNNVPGSSAESRVDMCGLAGGPSTSSHGSQSLLKRSTAPYCVENGRNALKRRSKDREMHQSPRRFQHQSQMIGAHLANSRSPIRSNPSTSLAKPHAGSSSDISQSVESMDTADEFEDGVTNGNSATNGCAAGTPPTSTTIVEEFEELNDVWDGVDTADDINGQENGYSSPEDYQHLQKYMPIIELGHSISQFSQQLSSTNHSPRLIKRMNDAFSLICYSDPVQSNNSYLLSQRERNFVAKALNKAILDQLGRERYSKLDIYIRKTRTDRGRAMPFSTSVVFADVDRLLFSRTPSGNALNAVAHGTSVDSLALSDFTVDAVPMAAVGSTTAPEDDNSNSSGGSSLGLSGAFDHKV